MEYLASLNEAQRAAVENTEGPTMVIAGAGSGKTRVLTYRIVHLLNKGVDSFNILSLTFTNKAARSMKERIGKILGDQEARNLWMGTFHSIFARILRVEAEKLGFPSNFTIYDSDDTKSLLKTIIKELGLDDKIYKPGQVYNRISSAKNNLITPGAYIKDVTIQSDDSQSGRPRIGEIYRIYQRRLFKASAMDFDDLLFKTNVLLRDNPDVLHKYQLKFQYIMVDEFQDTNFSQANILTMLAAKRENICVVGDDAQSIYAFRGANIQNILNFQKNYPDAKVFKLEQNYRSTKSIVQAANSVISKNREQLPKDVWTDNEAGSEIPVIRTLTDNEEGMTVANLIFDHKNNEQANNFDFAILYRTNAQSRAMEEALRKLGIPYRIYGGLSFYQRKEIKDLLGYYRMAANPNDEEALKRVINYPARGIGKTTLDRIVLAAGEMQVSLWQVLNELPQLQLKINGPTRERIQGFVTMIRSWGATVNTANAYDLGSQIASMSGITKELHTDKTPEGVSRYENIQGLLSGLKEFSEQPAENEAGVRTLAEFMQDVALLTDTDNDDPNDRDKVSLMTVHAAKGLEFPYVFVVGMEENLFPSQMSVNSRADLEEERRLFYVALTRAEKVATITYSTSRYRWGDLIHCEPSRFIEEIDPKFLRMNEGAPVSQVRSTSGSSSFAKPGSFKPPPTMRKKLLKVSESSGAEKPPPPKLATGMQVTHERFGPGKVLNLEGTYPNQKATIFFKGVGQKQLLLKFAKLEVVG